MTLRHLIQCGRREEIFRGSLAERCIACLAGSSFSAAATKMKNKLNIVAHSGMIFRRLQRNFRISLFSLHFRGEFCESCNGIKKIACFRCSFWRSRQKSATEMRCKSKFVAPSVPEQLKAQRESGKNKFPLHDAQANTQGRATEEIEPYLEVVYEDYCDRRRRIHRQQFCVL